MRYTFYLRNSDNITVQISAEAPTRESAIEIINSSFRPSIEDLQHDGFEIKTVVERSR